MEEDDKTIDSFMHEVTAMKNLSHPNIVNMKDFARDGILEKGQKEQRNVCYFVLELANKGELFDYVATTGAFSEDVARYYFH
jgi:serine/threonine protein kinase